MDYFFLLNYRVLRRELGKNTEVALENVFGVMLPSEKGRLKASPVLPFFPAQVQPLGCAVMSRECASWTCCIHLPPLTRPAGTSLLLSSGQACSAGRHSLALRTSRVTGGPGPKGKTFFSHIYIFFEEHSCLQLLLQQIVCVDQTPVLKTHSPTILDYTKGRCGPVFQLYH